MEGREAVPDHREEPVMINAYDRSKGRLFRRGQGRVVGEVQTEDGAQVVKADFSDVTPRSFDSYRVALAWRPEADYGDEDRSKSLDADLVAAYNAVMAFDACFDGELD